MRITLNILLFGLALAFTAPAQDTYSYDKAGRLIAVDYEGGTRVRYNYDKNGNILSVEVTSTSSASEARTPQKPPNRSEKPAVKRTRVTRK